jgi:hypothetical protein
VGEPSKESAADAALDFILNEFLTVEAAQDYCAVRGWEPVTDALLVDHFDPKGALPPEVLAAWLVGQDPFLACCFKANRLAPSTGSVECLLFLNEALLTDGDEAYWFEAISRRLPTEGQPKKETDPSVKSWMWLVPLEGLDFYGVRLALVREDLAKLSRVRTLYNAL